jgi:uncharacterized protein involved in exopolysaccharide biosynthesis
MVTHAPLPERHEQLDSIAAAEISTEQRMSVLDFLIILAERKRIILWVTAACTVLSIILSLLLPKKYTASSTILPPQQNSSMANLLSSQLAGLGSMAALAGASSGSLGLKNPNDMYVAMLRSRTVEDGMVQQFGLMQEYHAKIPSQARKAFESTSKVEGNGKDGLIHIAVTASDAKRAAELTNGYVDQFRKLTGHLAITEADQRRLFFERQLEQAKNDLADAEEALKRTEQETGLIELDSQARALIQTAAAIRAQITAKEVQIHSLQTFATDQNSELVQAQKELESLREQLAKLGGSEGSDALIVPKGKVPEAGLAYLRKLRDVKYHEAIFEILSRQFETAKLDEAKQGAVVQVIDAAVPPDARSSPHRTLIVLGGALLGLILGAIAVVFVAGLEQIRANPATGPKIEAFFGALFHTTRRIR